MADDVDLSRVRFFRHSQRSGWGTVDPDWVERHSLPGTTEAIEVAVVDFPECLRRFGVPYYLKVDIEGAYRACIEALHEFENRPAYISLEAERLDFALLREELELLASLA